ncbi:MAG: aspartate kinase [Actinomycetota bacterium]|nr:aspartate kinase [Actinomycetota bacterium]
MATIVQKFGGSSVADIERIKNVARRVVGAKKAGNSVVVVVSALGDTTDELIRMAKGITDHPPARELDMLLSTGEQISVALLSMAIDALGSEAISFTGQQVGILTDSVHTKAKILDINSDRIERALKEGKIVIVAGFQGVNTGGDITTLGRGGSDTTAVALAATLKADVCEIYTDVDGIYTADPRIVSDARKLDEILFEEMLEMAATGAKVMQTRSVEFGKNHGVPIRVRSSFSDDPGTLIKEEDESMERAIISGVTHDTGEAKITILAVPDRPGIAARIFRSLAEANINVDMIIQNISEEGFTDISFTTPKEDVSRAKKVVDSLLKELSAKGSKCDESIAKVSLIGAGMRTHPGVAADMFQALADAGINIEMISTSSIKISCVIDEKDVEEAVKALHAKFKLSARS